uniref:anti-sigma factor family protein n=1 Tax=Pedobacter sp. TaxID=1411316 RepID=UPI003D7F526C
MMKSLEEQIWEYIDGLGTAQERAALEKKIAADPAFKALYQELMELNQLMGTIELEEPSMGFTRNIMEQIKLEPAPAALNTQVDKRIIYSLAAVFLLSIFTALAYVLANSSFTPMENPSFNFRINLDQLINPLVLQIFLYMDAILILLYLDRLYRSKK